jgi:cobalt-zinc-cadmium efflux system protein
MHLHAHDPAHKHAGLHQGPLVSREIGTVLGWAMVATVGLVLAEFAGGYLGHSISLISDAVHNLTDIPTMAISLLAARLAIRPPTHEKTYGYHRAGILAAFVNALLLCLVACYIFWEAYGRLRHPVTVTPGLMIWISLLALAVNSGITLGLMRGRRDLNLRAILVHNLGDALSNIAILVGALAIRWTGVAWVDPAIGLAIGAMVLWSAWGILRESCHILLEGMPRQISLEKLARVILRVEGVQEVHDIHVWTLGTNLQALSCHIRIPDMHMEESERILSRIQECLQHEFHITHTTIQFERAGLPAAGYIMPARLRSSSE